MIEEPGARLKPLFRCEGDQDKCSADMCPLTNTPQTRRYRDGLIRVRGCMDPAARGRRNRLSGKRGERQARKIVSAKAPTQAHANVGEEALGGPLLTEIKSDKRHAKPVWTHYQHCEDQAEHSRAIGDNRPFVALFRPPGVNETLVVVRGSRLRDVVADLAHEWGLT